jgi:hypothetical protein
LTASTQDQSVAAIYDSQSSAAAAVQALQRAGFDVNRLSIVGRGHHTAEHAIGLYTSGDRMRFWGERGTFWETLWGVLSSSGFFLLPGIGPLVVMGPLVGGIVGALEGAATCGSHSILAAALMSIGIPIDSAVRYEPALKGGGYLIIAHGATALIESARSAFRTTGASEFAEYAAAA